MSNGITEETSNDWKPNRKEIYPILVSFAQQAEANSWNRFNNFLMFSSILILSWATIYTQVDRIKFAQLLMSLIAILGLLSGFIWAALGYRSRKFTTFFLREGSKIDCSANEGCNPCLRSLQLRDQFKFQFLGSFYILIGIPLFFSGFYLILFFVSLLIK